MRRSRRDVELGRKLAIGQQVRRRSDGLVCTIAQIRRVDCTVDVVTERGRRPVTFADLRDGWDQIVPFDPPRRPRPVRDHLLDPPEARQ